MERIPEKELMDDAANAAAYAQADFQAPHERFVDLLAERWHRAPAQARALDLGCGPGDVTLRLARRFPAFTIDAVDGSGPMLAHARAAVAAAGLEPRIRLIHARLPVAAPVGEPGYPIILSNSLLHHMAGAADFWAAVAQHGGPGSYVFVMDLMRPHDREAARAMVRQYAAGEPRVLQEDFYHSLLAAYRPAEVMAQLKTAGLPLACEVVSDRHWVVHGRL